MNNISHWTSNAKDLFDINYSNSTNIAVDINYSNSTNIAAAYKYMKINLDITWYIYKHAVVWSAVKRKFKI